MELRADFKVPVTVVKDEDWFVASCSPLDVWSQGRSREEALANLVDALSAFFLSCYERGTFMQVFRDAGFTVSEKALQDSKEGAPRPPGAEPETVLLPLVFRQPEEAQTAAR
jgi:predicted RNase H-like HicB family nuclease